MCVCVCARACVYVCVRTCVRACMRVCVCVCVFLSVSLRPRAQTTGNQHVVCEVIYYVIPALNLLTYLITQEDDYYINMP